MPQTTLATAVGRLEKEITYSVTTGVKDRKVPRAAGVGGREGDGS